MRGGGLLLLGLFWAGSSLGQEPAYGYLPFKMLHGPQDPFPYYLDGRSPNPAGLLLSDVQAATERAWKTWDSVSCASTAFSFLGPTGSTVPEPRDPYDVFNVSTVWISSQSDPYYLSTVGSGDVAAITIPLTYAGVLKQCDIYLNAADHIWSAAQQVPSTALDVETIVLHEAGHCQGLDHTYDWSYASSAMYAEPTLGRANRALQQLDADALCSRYPSSGQLGSPCGADGGCGADPALKCVSVPKMDGGTGKSICSKGCPLNQNYECGIPLVCLSSLAFQPEYGGACLPPGDYVTQVGRPCLDSAQCGSTNGACFAENVLPSGFPNWEDGYCSQDCAPGQPPCPAGSSCLEISQGTLRCLKQCRVGYGDCRPGYACILVDGFRTGFCVPRCYKDVDCNPPGGTQNQCRLCDGICLSIQNPSGQLGDACSSSASCGTGQDCLKWGYSNVGVCSQSCARACAACPTGSTCQPVGAQGGDLYCLRNCTGPGTCPGGLQCGATRAGKGCVPPCKTELDCPVGTNCVGGQCQAPETSDGGCALCGSPDSGRPTEGVRDGGSGPSVGGGCGCRSTDDLSLLFWLLSCTTLLWQTRRRT